MKRRAPNRAVYDEGRQEKLLAECERFSGIRLPS